MRPTVRNCYNCGNYATGSRVPKTCEACDLGLTNWRPVEVIAVTRPRAVKPT